MSSVLNKITPETAAIIESQAKRRGLSADGYLRRLLLSEDEPSFTERKITDKEFDADMKALAEDVESHSDHKSTYNREEIYFDHN